MGRHMKNHANQKNKRLGQDAYDALLPVLCKYCQGLLYWYGFSQSNIEDVLDDVLREIQRTPIWTQPIDTAADLEAFRFELCVLTKSHINAMLRVPRQTDPLAEIRPAFDPHLDEIAGLLFNLWKPDQMRSMFEFFKSHDAAQERRREFESKRFHKMTWQDEAVELNLFERQPRDSVAIVVSKKHAQAITTQDVGAAIDKYITDIARHVKRRKK
jgi:hypothetical protein